MKAQGKFYSVGIGPGDETLITLKAVQVLGACDVVCIPDSASGNMVALDIVKNYVQEKNIKTFLMPMTRDKKKLQESHDQATQEIATLLDQGQQCAFVTLGDPSIYATAAYVHQRLQQQGYETEVIPGVPSFCAAAARLQIPLCEGEEPLFILPTTQEEHQPTLKGKGTMVFMKSGKNLLALRERLLEEPAQDIYFVEKATMPEEKIWRGNETIQESTSYFTLTIVKKRS